MSKISRIDNAQFFRLGEALEQAVGCTLDGIENLRVTAVDQRKENNGKKGPYSIQRLHVADGGVKATVQAWNFPDLTGFNGTLINLESTPGRDGTPYGVMIDEYQGEIRIKLSESGLIDNVEDAQTSPENQWQNVEAHEGVFGKGGNAGVRQQPQQRGGRQQAPAQRQAAPAPRGGGNAQRQQPSRQQAQTRGPADRHEKKPIFGATVGMALNQAGAVIREWTDAEGKKLGADYYLSRQFSIDLYTVSSDYLRVAERLERGDIAASAKKREEANKTERVNFVDKETGDTSTAQAPARQHRAERPDDGSQQDTQDFGEGPISGGMEEDEIPF